MVSTLEAIPLGAAIMGGGVIFWYMPRTKRYRMVRNNNLAVADTLRSKGHESSARRIETLYENAGRKLPFYGKLFFITGAIIFSYGVYRAL